MRIIYDYAGQTPHIPAAPTSAKRNGRETVLVIKVGNDAEAESVKRHPSRRHPISPGKATDQAWAVNSKVHGHENAHLSALGPYAASGILYSTITTPSGESIAVGGSIAVDLQEVPGDPEATLRKARTVLNASMAPGSPSGADLRVAARAYRLMQKAKSELGVSEYA
ncbi:MAG: hypothetical protein E4H20_06080 [Spirochaetales bacterium]|nr:MAG: hypothetical protein E4H20_06080 [Spirochaetales bacterium]